MIYLTKHDTLASYYAVKDSLPKPQVAYVVEDDTVHYNPIRTNIITYKAASKLAETTSTSTVQNALHVNCFSGNNGTTKLNIVGHSFDSEK